MAEYQSKYSELGFYVNGSLRQFRNGTYKTEDKSEIDVLDKLKDVTKIAEAKPKKETPKTPKKAKSSAKK